MGYCLFHSLRLNPAFSNDLLPGIFLIIKHIQAEIQISAHIAGLLWHHNSFPLKFTAHHQIRRLHDLQHGNALADCMGHSARYVPNLPGLYRNLFKACIHFLLVLILYNPFPFLPPRRVLKAQTDIRVNSLPHIQYIITFQLSIRFSHNFIGKPGGRMSLNMQTHSRIQNLQKKAKLP